jgi:hypothetical protein
MLLAAGCLPDDSGGGGEDAVTDTEPPEMDAMDAGDTGPEIRDAGDTAELDATDTSKARITTDASKVDCGGAPCEGHRRCYRPGQGSDLCDRRMCNVDPGCPDKCLRRCLKRCFVDGTCDNPEEECVAGNAEGARVCVPGGTDAG